MSGVSQPVLPPNAPAGRSFVWRLFVLGSICVVYGLAYWELHQLSKIVRGTNLFALWYGPPALTLLLLIWGGRRWWPLILGVTWIANEPLFPAVSLMGVVMAIVITTIYWGAALILCDWVEIDVRLRRLSDVLWFLGIAIIIAPFMTALSVVSTLVLVDLIEPTNFPANIIEFWLGDAIGIISITPALLTHIEVGSRWWKQVWHAWRTRPLTVWLQLGNVVLLGVICMVLYERFDINTLYLAVLPLLWIAITAGFPRTTLAVSIINLLALNMILLGWIEAYNVISMQLFLLTISISGLIGGAVTSERYLAEQRVKASDEYFRALINFSTDMISILDQQGRVKFETPSVGASLGYPDGLLGHDVFSFIHPEDRGKVMDTYTNHVKYGGVSPVVQYRLRHSDGSWRWVESVANNQVHPSSIDGIIINSRDITARHLAEEQVRFQANVLDQVENAVFVVDTALRIVFWNHAAALLYDREHTDVIDDTLLNQQLAPPDQHDLLIAGLQRCMHQASTWQGEIDAQSRNGYLRPVFVTATPLRNQRDQINGVVCVSSDISARKQAEQRLIESERYFRSLIEHASDLISIIDESGLIYYHSPSVSHILGYRDGLVGHNAFEYIHPDDRTSLQMMLRRKIMRVTIGKPVIFRFRHQNNSWRMLETVSNLLDPRPGETHRIVLNSRDITERKQLEEALTVVAQGVASVTDTAFFRTLVQQLSQTLRAAYAHIGLFDASHRMIVTLSASERGYMVENFTYPIEGSPAERVFSGVTAVYRAGVQRMFPNDPALAALEIESYLALPLQDDSGVVLGILVVMDSQQLENVPLTMSLMTIFAQRITSELKRKSAEEQRLQMERKLLETQKLESLGLLAGGIAHDFNNFLTTILGNISLAQLDIDDPLLIGQYLHAIETAARHAADLCRQMLAYSGKGRVILHQIELNTLVHEMGNLLMVSIGKNIQLEYRFTPDLPPIEGDVSQIRQVVMNLIVNAAEAIGERRDGNIQVKTGLVQADQAYLDRMALPSLVQPGEFVTLEVGDNGTGMDEDTIAKIFDPFFTTKFTGRGLGLAAVQGIIRSHGGTITVYSHVGKGSIFKILLPSSLGTVLNHIPTQRLVTLPTGGVLVIDDEAAIRSTVANMVRACGMNVITADSGLNGLELFEEHQNDIRVVLLDLTMPGLNGEETFQQLRQIDPVLPVILMSGYSRSEVVAHHSDGRSAFLQKPFPLDELRSALARVLNAADTPF